MRSGGATLVALSILFAAAPLSPASASHRFGGAAGWTKATGESPSPIRVWSQRRLGVDVGASIEPWNWLAGWRLFSKTGSKQKADVVFLPSRSPDTWTECPPTYVEPFDRCIVWVADPSIEMSRHELGHTLGFADHIQAAQFAEGRHIAAKVCDSSDHPQFSAYHGVMSYCDWSNDFRGWFGPKDRLMLRRAGYLREETLDRPRNALIEAAAISTRMVSPETMRALSTSP